MGQLFLVNESFELQNVPENKRDELLINFCKALNLAKVNRDSFYGTVDIYSRHYSYGPLFSGFLLSNISQIKHVDSLKGISDVSLSLFQSLAYAVPGLINIIKSQESYLEDFKDDNYGFCGMDFLKKPNPFVGCDICWEHWKIAWYSLHQDAIFWPNGVDDNLFLPNLRYSNKILLSEITKKETHDFKENSKKVFFDRSNIGLSFHDNVMRSQGSNLAAYTIKIGGEIAKANFYNYDAVLSNNETRAAGNSMRSIYKILGEDGLFKYISLDHRHGMFEFHNYKGEHLGEFKFDGSYNSEADVSHNFKTIS